MSWKQTQDELNRLSDTILEKYRQRARDIHNKCNSVFLMDGQFAAEMAVLHKRKHDLWDKLRRELCSE